MRRFKLLDVILDLFDGSGAGTSGDTGGSQAASSVAGETTSGGSQRVLYGKQTGAAAPEKPAKEDSPSVAGEEQKAATPEEKRKAYRELMEGEYKDQYTEDMQTVLNRRFRETEDLRERLGQWQPTIDILMQRYGIQDGDPAKLAQAVEGDDLYLAKAADEAGMSVEQFKHLQMLERQNAELLREQRARLGQEQANRQLMQWDMETREAQQVYPGLDLQAELQDPRFADMLRARVPVRLAYEVVHMDDIKAGIAAEQAKATEKQVSDNIRAKGARPSENGVSSQGGFVVKNNVSQLTNKDMEEINRRVMRGERISFG